MIESDFVVMINKHETFIVKCLDFKRLIDKTKNVNKSAFCVKMMYRWCLCIDVMSLKKVLWWFQKARPFYIKLCSFLLEYSQKTVNKIDWLSTKLLRRNYCSLIQNGQF